MSGKIDFSNCEPHELAERAVVYKKQLSAYFSRVVSDQYIEKAVFSLYHGEPVPYEGFIDYTHPTLRRIVREGTLPRAKDLLDTARQKGCADTLTKIFGEHLVHVIDTQVPDPVVQHAYNLPRNQCVRIKDEQLHLFCLRVAQG